MIGHYYVKDQQGIRLVTETFKKADLDPMETATGMHYVKNSGWFFLDKEKLLKSLDNDMLLWSNRLQEKIQEATEELERLNITYTETKERLK